MFFNLSLGLVPVSVIALYLASLLNWIKNPLENYGVVLLVVLGLTWVLLELDHRKPSAHEAKKRKGA